jgi:hypothetical protein
MSMISMRHTYPTLGKGVKAAAEKAVKKLSRSAKPAGARG